MAAQKVALTAATLCLGINDPQLLRVRIPDASYGLYVYGTYAIGIAARQLGARHRRVRIGFKSGS